MFHTTTIKRLFVSVAVVISLSFITHVHAQQWALTPQTYVGFDIKPMGFALLKGRFNQFQSSMSFDPETPENASAQFTLQVDSLNVSIPSLKNMILAEDLFYANKYATATFNSHQFIPLGNYKYSIKGTLTLRGVSQAVTLNTVLKPNAVNSHRLDVESYTVIQRSDFGMKKALGGIGENVNIRLAGQWQEI